MKWIKKNYDAIFQNKVIMDYAVFKSIKKTSVINNITTRQVINILNSNNIPHKVIRKINIKETYFDNYNNPDCNNEVLYWIGFIAADGNVMNNSKSRSYFMTVKLSAKDENHLIKLRDCLSSNAKIKTIICKGGIRVDRVWKDSICSVIVFNSKYLVNSLAIFNIVPAKSKIYSFPTVLYNHQNINSFIRGYFDGDGSISFKENKLRLNFYGTRTFLNKIAEIISKNCSISQHYSFKNRTIFNLEYNGVEAIKLAKWMYNNSNDKIMLNRKYDILKFIF